MSRTALALIMTAAMATVAAAAPLHMARVVPNAGGGGGGSATLTYYGGPIIQNVKVVTVFWGSGVQFSGSGTQSINAFYTSVIQSAYYDWLSFEYNTTSPTAQKIGRGTFGGCSSTRRPRSATTIDDTGIQDGARQAHQRRQGPGARRQQPLHVPLPRRASRITMQRLVVVRAVLRVPRHVHAQRRERLLRRHPRPGRRLRRRMRREPVRAPTTRPWSRRTR